MSQGITRRGFLTGASSVFALTAAGCGARGGSSNQVTFLNEETDPPQLNYLRQAVSEYQKETGMRVNITQSTIGGRFQQLVKSLRAGDAFDLSTSDTNVLGYLQRQDALRAVDDIVRDAGGQEEFLPQTLYPVNNSFYWMPYGINCSVAYYRSDYLEDVGESVPRTWDDLKRVAMKFSRSGKPGIAFPYGMQPATNGFGCDPLWTNQVELLDAKGNVILDHEPTLSRCVQSLEFLRELKPYMISGMENADLAALVNSFVQGTAGIVTTYSGRIVDTILRNAPDLADKFVISGYPTPEADMEFAGTKSINGWLIPKQSQSGEEAVKFLAWFVEHKFLGWILTSPFNLIPPIRTVYENKRWQSDPQVQEHKDTIKTFERFGKGEGYRGTGLFIGPPGIGALKQKIFSANVVPIMYQKVLLRGDDPQRAIRGAADQLRKLTGPGE